MTSLRTDQASPTLRYLDTNGAGSPDGFVAVNVSQIGLPDADGTVVCRVVETSATGIGLDGIPSHIHVHERVLESSVGGESKELATHDLEIEPDNPEEALALLHAAAGQERSSSRSSSPAISSSGHHPRRPLRWWRRTVERA